MDQKFIAELKLIVAPFLKAGIYKTEDEALENIVEGIVDARIESYKKTIRMMEEKYKTTFSRFNEVQKSGKMGIREEDEWMEWEAAVNMLEAWSKVKKDIVYAS